MVTTGGAKRSKALAVVAGGLLVLTACGTAGVPSGGATSGGVSGTGAPSPAVSDSPSGSPTPGETTTPGGAGTPVPAVPSESLSSSPGPSDTNAPLGTGSPTPGPTGSPATCTTVDPIRIEKVASEPRRTTEVVAVVSDGKNLTSGTREQTDFMTPLLEGPDGTAVTDEATSKKVSSLIAAAGKNRVLLVRPEGPDANASANRRPFNAPGTYVLFNASALLTANVIVECGGQEQRWTFTAEADPTIGQVNCAVEPPKTNAIARLVYVNNC